MTKDIEAVFRARTKATLRVMRRASQSVPVKAAVDWKERMTATFRKATDSLPRGPLEVAALATGSLVVAIALPKLTLFVCSVGLIPDDMGIIRTLATGLILATVSIVVAHVAIELLAPLLALSAAKIYSDLKSDIEFFGNATREEAIAKVI